MKVFQFSVLPFLFAHWVGPALLTGHLSFLVILLVLRRIIITNTVKVNRAVFVVVLVIIVFSLFNLGNIIHGIKLYVAYQNLYLFLNIFLLFILFYFLEPWNLKTLQTVSKIIFYIASFSIVGEFIAVNFLNISNEIMPAFKDVPAYYLPAAGGWYRPFGLTGNSSVNGGVLLFSFLLLSELGLLKLRFYILFIVGALLTVSGQVYFCSLFTLVLLFFSNIKFWIVKWSLTFVFCALIIYVANLNMFQKLSLDYLIYVLIHKADIGITLDHLNIWQLAFGTLGVEFVPANGGLVQNDEGLSEIYLVSSIRINGIIFTLFLWSFVYYILKKTQRKYIIFAAVFFSSLHYPSIIFFEAQLPLMLLYAHANLREIRFQPEPLT